MKRIRTKLDRCIGCKLCEIACTKEHSSSGDLVGATGESPKPFSRIRIERGIRILSEEERRAPFGDSKRKLQARSVYPLRCIHCPEPKCVEACITGGLRRLEDGTVFHDPQKCVGCWMCIMACPFGAIRQDMTAHTIVKCDLCPAREVPACVEVCPTDALQLAVQTGIKEAVAERVVKVEKPMETDSYRYVIIGNSAAGIATVEGIRKVDTEGSIAIISDETMKAYCRCLTSYFIMGRVDEKGLLFRPESFYEDMGVTPLLGRRVKRLDPSENLVHLEGGARIGYEKLMLATGASAIIYDVPGNDKKGVCKLRTFEDALEISKMALWGKKACVLGGGLVGLKTADALHARGVETYVMVTSSQIMSQTMDKEGADLIQARLEANNLHVITGVSVEEILGDEQVKAVRLSNGRIIDCDIVVFGKGVNPNIDLAVDAGIETGYGILVDEMMRSSIPNIYAAGDVAEALDLIGGKRYIHAIWPNAVEQGKVAGQNMAGKQVKYKGGIGMNSVQLFGLSSISLGVTKLRKPDPSYESFSRYDEAGPYYRKIMLKDGVLVGAVLIGSVESAGIFGELIRHKRNVSGMVDILLDENFDYAKMHDIDILEYRNLPIKA